MQYIHALQIPLFPDQGFSTYINSFKCLTVAYRLRYTAAFYVARPLVYRKISTILVYRRRYIAYTFTLYTYRCTRARIRRPIE